MRLTSDTSPEWLVAVNANLDRFLQDHASCEKKASGTALHLASHYPDKPELVRSMIALAREELDHFARVYDVLVERNSMLAPDERDPYIRALLKEVRTGSAEFLLDRLLVFGVVEARGCERFRLLGDGVSEPGLRGFYQELARAEAKHWAMFVRLAKLYFPPGEVDARLAELLRVEGELIARSAIRCALH